MTVTVSDSELLEKHRATLEAARAAIRERRFWSAFPEHFGAYAADVRSVVCGLTAYATAAPPASPSRPHNSATRSPRTLMRHTVSTAGSPPRNRAGCNGSAARLRTAVTGGIVAG